MTEKCISSIHIQKLGHEILEIRERALTNLKSKLENGFVYDNDLARSREMLTKLLEWFLHDPCTQHEQVFGLIKRLLHSASGAALVAHFGSAPIKHELKRLRSYIDPAHHAHLDELLDALNALQVPPLESELPLSHRSGDWVGSTATTIAGRVSQPASAQAQAAPARSALRWQALVAADRHVLQAIETNLRRPPDAAALLHSADFFRTVLLRDFPAEVFLQRPYLVLTLLNMVGRCASTRITNAIFSGVAALTRSLQVRVNHGQDAAMANEKVAQVGERLSGNSAKDVEEEDDEGETWESLRKYEISIPSFCYTGYKTVFKYLCQKAEGGTSRRVSQKGVNYAICLLSELLELLALVVNGEVWNCECGDITKQLGEILIGFGVALEHFRVESGCDDTNLNNRVTHLCLIQNCTSFLVKLVPITQTGLLIPRNLKTALCNTLLDVTLTKLYSQTHQTIFRYVESFDLGNDLLCKYHDTTKICNSMSSAVKFMQSSRTCNIVEGVSLALDALPCLEFHQDLRFVEEVVELAAGKLPIYSDNRQLIQQVENLILKLLAHSVGEIQEKIYTLCHNKVISAIGPRSSDVPCDQITFLLSTNIFVEIASQGLASTNPRIEHCAEDLLIYILKARLLVSDELWSRTITALLLAFPILLLNVHKTSSLGRALLNLADPDVATSMLIPKIDILKLNIQLLFFTDSHLREEGFSRVCWLLSTQADARVLLPHITNLQDRALPTACQIRRPVDLNRSRTVQHCYQPSSLQQVFDLLRSTNVEPVIRRSALTQISVMCEDPLLHPTFLDLNGIGLCLDILKSAMIEHKYCDYPDSIIPIVSILKSVCLHHVRVRQELASNIELCFGVLRGLFMFFAEERLKQDAATLLFLLIFTDYVHGSPANGDLSIPFCVSSKLRVPFACHTHWEVSPHYEEKKWDLVASERSCLTSVQIQWNLEIFHGISNLISMKKLNYEDNPVVDRLRMGEYELQSLKASSIQFCVRKHLNLIQNSSTYELIIESINSLTIYLQLYKTTNVEIDGFLEDGWEPSFGRFLRSLPSGEEDANLLSAVINFLHLLVPFYSNADKTNWITQLVKKEACFLLDLIPLEQTSNEEYKILSQDVLALITQCVINEQNYLDYYTSNKVERESWSAAIEIIANSLKFSDSTHFFNLAYLDSILTTLVHLTALLGWSRTLKATKSPKRVLTQLVSSLCELVVVFHCGKGPTAAISVMGLSITRNVILILNHLLAEMHHIKLRCWEDCFLEVDEEGWLKSFMILWQSRDVILRAGAIQLFAGMVKSPRLALEIVNELKIENGSDGIWGRALLVLVDVDEASVVRENCALLLANLTAHVHIGQGDQVITGFVPACLKKGKDEISAIFDLFETHDFYKYLIIVLNSLYTTNFESDLNLCDDLMLTSRSFSTESSESKCTIATPSLVRSLCVLLQNLNHLNSNRLTKELLEAGLVKLIFRSLCNPTMEINTTRKLSIYCELLEMNTAICSLLAQLVRNSSIVLGTILHTTNCMNLFVSLLNQHYYHANLPQLVYLRNRLWSKIYNFLSVLLNENESGTNCHKQEALRIVSEAIYETSGQRFVDTLTLAITNASFDELQTSALILLSVLLKTESGFLLSDENPKSIHNLLDTVRTYTIDTNRSENSAIKPISTISGCELARILLNLYDLCTLKVSKEALKKKSLITSALSTLLCVSQEAKTFANHSGMVKIIMKQIKEIQVTLSLEAIDSMRKTNEKKRLLSILKDLDDLIGLTTNFLLDDVEIKSEFARVELCDLIHKVWNWVLLQKNTLVNVLRLICNLTADNLNGGQALNRTSQILGSNQRKGPSKVSLLSAIIGLIEREMDSISKTHNLEVLDLSLTILTNCCLVTECRIQFIKSTLLNVAWKLHPALTRKSKIWEGVEGFWLEFLQVFTLYPEGQAGVVKNGELLDILLALTSSPKNRLLALLVVRNASFYQSNRSRLLTSDGFLRVLRSKLESGSREEKEAVVLMLWTLGANNQKAKIIFKSAQFDTKLEQMLRYYELEEADKNENIERIKYVLKIIRDGDLKKY